MPTNVLGTGTSALIAFQRALATVGHNVANAATPGYSRQRVELRSRDAGVRPGQEYRDAGGQSQRSAECRPRQPGPGGHLPGDRGRAWHRFGGGDAGRCE